MKIIDITRELLSAEVYPGDTPPTLTPAARAEEGGFNTSDLNCCVHNGTHIDAPRHVENGGASASDIPLEKCFGPCRVITADGRIRVKDLKAAAAAGVKKVLIRNARIGVLAAIGAALLKLDLIGTEEQSIGDERVHKLLLRSGLVVLEGLDLSNAEDGDYILSALPLKIDGADGTPVRAVLIKGK